MIDTTRIYRQRIFPAAWLSIALAITAMWPQGAQAAQAQEGLVGLKCTETVTYTTPGMAPMTETHAFVFDKKTQIVHILLNDGRIVGDNEPLQDGTITQIFRSAVNSTSIVLNVSTSGDIHSSTTYSIDRSSLNFSSNGRLDSGIAAGQGWSGQGQCVVVPAPVPRKNVL